MYRGDCETRELRAKIATFEATERQVRGEWENTCEDLTKELKYVQGEMTQKEIVFQRVEQELRHKLTQMGEVQKDERGELVRRIEDLQAEMQHLANTKQEKDERLRAQVQRNEQLLSDLERMNMELTSVKEDKEQTLQ